MRRTRPRLAHRKASWPATPSGCRPRSIGTSVRHPARRTDRRVTAYWGPPPGELFVDRHDPTARSSSPTASGQPGTMVRRRAASGRTRCDLPRFDRRPATHYLAAYRWLDTGFSNGFGAHAVVHLGANGQPGMVAGKDAGHGVLRTRSPLGDLPLIYPFLVNDPGEGNRGRARTRC